MRPRLVSIAIMTLAVTAPAFPPTSAQAQLGTSKWSLELGTDVGSFDEFVFAVRRHSGANTAFRFALETNVNHIDGDGTVVETGTPDEDVATLVDIRTLGLAVHWMRFAQVREGLSATFATGPSIRQARGTVRTGQGYGTASFSEGESRQEELAFGWEFLLGADWFFSPRFSLGGSTGLRAEIGSLDVTQIARSGAGATYSVREAELETDVARVSLRPARIQLSAYF